MPKVRSKGLLTAMYIEQTRRTENLYDFWYGGVIRDENLSGRYAGPISFGRRRYALYSQSLAG